MSHSLGTHKPKPHRVALHALLNTVFIFNSFTIKDSFAAPGDTLYTENFNNNLALSDWTISGTTAEIGNKPSGSGNNNSGLSIYGGNVTATSDPINLAVPGAELAVWIRRGIDETGVSENPDGGEDLILQYFSDSGAWLDLESFAGGGTPGEIFNRVYTLPAAALHAGFRVRFNYPSASGSQFDYWHADDLVITETAGGTPSSCDTYRDNFSSANYTNSDGSLDWTANSWVETNDNGSANSGLVRISSSNLRLSGNDSNNNTAITRQADTDGANSVTLTLDFNVTGGIEVDDAALIEISSDGINFDTLETLVGFVNNTSESRTYDVTAYASPSMQIRLAIAPDNNAGDCCFSGGGERIEFDYVQIESCIVTVPSPLAEYRLDELTWNGSNGEVLDSSGNNLSGRTINLNGLPTTDDANRAIPGNPGTCGYGVFDGTMDGYVQINDPGTGSLLDLSPNFSVAVWIYPTALPNSDLHTIVSKDTNFEFHLNPSGQVFWWWGGGSRQLFSSNSVTLNAWNHIVITYAPGSQVIYLNGANVGTNTSSAAISTNNDPLFIGTDLNFHSRRFNGFIDEVKLYDETLTSEQVAIVQSETHACAAGSVDHYQITHSGTGVTCEAENVVITARDSSDQAIAVSGRTIRVSATSTTPGWNISDATWSLNTGGGSVSFPSPGVIDYQFANGESAVILALANSSEALIDIDIVDLGNLSIGDLDGTVDDPALNFVNTAFRFYNDADGDGNADGTNPIATPITSGAVSSPLILRAIETNLETGACQARLLGNQTVLMAYECVNPVTCIRNQDMRINATTIEENDLNNIVDYQAVPLTFDAQGEAPFVLQYFDVGQVRLHASLSIPAAGSEPAITLTGASAPTVIQPANIVISNVQGGGGESNPGTSTSGSGFISSDASFSLVAQVQNAQGGLTPNFGNEIASESLRLNINSLVMPAGGNPGVLSGATSFTATSTAGEFSNSSLRWNEAGTIRVNADIADGDYLSSGNIVGSASSNIGRFYPDRFNLLSSSVDAGCLSGGFSYMSDQSFGYLPITTNYTVRAESSTGSLLQNYDASLSYPVIGFTGVAENNNSGTDLSSRSQIPSGTWTAGEMNVTGTNNTGFRRGVSGFNEVVDGPYNNLQFGLRVASSTPDNIDFDSGDLDMNPNSSGDCTIAANCNAASLGSSQNLLFARLVTDDAFGPESAPLSTPFTIEYWNGALFASNSNDSCTQLSASTIQFNNLSIDNDANRTVSVGGGSSTGSFGNFTVGVEMGFINGDGLLSFSAPGNGNTGNIAIDIDLSAEPWLRFDWNNNGDNSDDSSVPTSYTTFGSYRGHDRVIYWREVFQ